MTFRILIRNKTDWGGSPPIPNLKGTTRTDPKTELTILEARGNPTSTHIPKKGWELRGPAKSQESITPNLT